MVITEVTVDGVVMEDFSLKKNLNMNNDIEKPPNPKVNGNSKCKD